MCANLFWGLIQVFVCVACQIFAYRCRWLCKKRFLKLQSFLFGICFFFYFKHCYLLLASSVTRPLGKLPHNFFVGTCLCNCLFVRCSHCLFDDYAFVISCHSKFFLRFWRWIFYLSLLELLCALLGFFAFFYEPWAGIWRKV